MIVWIAIQLRGKENAWEFQGVFSSENKAKEACKNDKYFIGPAEMDKLYPNESIDGWPGAYYPTLQDGPTEIIKGE